MNHGTKKLQKLKNIYSFEKKKPVPSKLKKHPTMLVAMTSLYCGVLFYMAMNIMQKIVYCMIENKFLFLQIKYNTHF